VNALKIQALLVALGCPGLGCRGPDGRWPWPSQGDAEDSHDAHLAYHIAQRLGERTEPGGAQLGAFGVEQLPVTRVSSASDYGLPREAKPREAP
jgi:hypothetical protein